MERQVGKYTIKFLHLKNYDYYDCAKITCGKVKYYANLSMTELHTMKITEKESDIAHILKVERMRRKRELAALEKLLSEGD